MTFLNRIIDDNKWSNAEIKNKFYKRIDENFKGIENSIANVQAKNA